MSLFRSAIRVFRHQPAFAAAAIVTVALGTGASTAVFSTVNGVLLRSLPYPNGDRVVHLTQPALRNHNQDAAFSVTELADYRTTARTLGGIAEYHSMPFQIYGIGDPIRAETGVVSAHFFDVLGVRPIRGRLFRAGEDAIGAHPVVVVSHRFWVERLGADTAVVGTTFTMNDKVHEIVGILPPLPAYPNQNDIWMPAGACPFRSSQFMMSTRGARMVQAYALLSDGATVASATADVKEVQRRLQETYPDGYRPTNPLSIEATGLMTELTARATPILWTLLATSIFLLVIATANFANLMLASQLKRSDEFALRTALGAGDRTLLRQLVVESLSITVPGAALGALIAFASLGMLRTLAAGITPRASEISLDWTVLGFALAISLGVGLAAAIAPFLRFRATVVATGAIATAVRGARSHRLQDGLIAVQLGVAVVVLIGAGLLTKSLIRLERVDRLPNAEQVASARIDLNWSRYTTRGSVIQFAEGLLQRATGSPGVAAIALATSFPLNASQGFRAPVTTSRPEETGAVEARADLVSVGPGYFDILGLPLVAGRDFTVADRDSVSPPVVVSQAFARASWQTADPIGQRVSLDNGRNWHEVVGVAADVRQNDLTVAPSDIVYFPFASRPSSDFRVVARTRSAGTEFSGMLRRAVHEIDPRQPVGEFETVAEVRDRRLTQPRLTTVLLVGFAVISLALTIAGITGVVANGVGRRRKEIALQKALGAPSSRVVVRLIRPIAAMVVLGLTVGLIAALSLSKLIAGLLYAVPPTDPIVYGAVAVGVGLAALGAALWPSRAILKLDPASVLRGD